jgi:DNA invertase Pin-like site-specific DNA recombinase
VTVLGGLAQFERELIRTRRARKLSRWAQRWSIVQLLGRRY